MSYIVHGAPITSIYRNKHNILNQAQDRPSGFIRFIYFFKATHEGLVVRIKQFSKS